MSPAFAVHNGRRVGGGCLQVLLPAPRHSCPDHCAVSRALASVPFGKKKTNDIGFTLSFSLSKVSPIPVTRHPKQNIMIRQPHRLYTDGCFFLVSFVLCCLGFCFCLFFFVF